MAKNMTPAIQKLEAQRAAAGGRKKRSGPLTEAWLRLIRNKTAILGLVILVLLVLVAALAPVIAPYGYDEVNMADKLMEPCLKHPFGTDQLGRDIFTRCLYGTRITLPVAVMAVAAAVLVGGSIGVIAAYFGGSVDNILMRFVDVWGSIPGIMLAVAIVAVFSGEGASVFQRELAIVCGLSMGAVPNMARTFRGAIFTVIGSDYVESSRAMGASHLRIMIKHLLPNAVGPVILSVVGLLGVEVLCVSALSFMGIGITPPTPEWGALLSAGRQYLSTAPYMCLYPGVMIMLAVLGFNLLGDGLRDALDPRLK